MKYKMNGKVIEVKKSLTGAEILRYEPCTDAFERYVKMFGFRTEPNEADVKKIIADDVFAPWLITKGFIAISDDIKTYAVGTMFRVNVKSGGTKDLTLCKVSDPRMGKGYCIWSLINMKSGERWDGSYPTKEKDFLTDKELSAVTGVKQPVENFYKAVIRDGGAK